MTDGYYEEEFIEKIKYSNDLMDLASEYTQLKKRGKNHMGLCPFHSENTPSFSVDPEKQLYYCFGCGAGGNIFNFIMEIEGLSFREAVEYLANRANIDLPEKDLSPEARKKRSEKQQLYEIHKLAARFYCYLLLESDVGKEGYNYLLNRGYTEETMKKFKLGFAPDRWEQLYKFLKKKGYSDKILTKSGLIISRKNNKGYYDRFRNRIMFSIFNHRGQPIGFGGRVLSSEDQPKYLNSPETLIFDKSWNLYGLNLAKSVIREREEVVIMEGYTDVLTAYQAGIENVVASLGTSLTKEQANLLNRYADKAYIAYDADAAGEKATLRGLDILREAGLMVEVIKLPLEQDPDEFIKQQGKEEFKKLKEKAVPLIQFKIDNVLEGKEFSTVEEKVSAVGDMLPILDEIQDEIERDEYMEIIARKLEIDVNALKREYNKYQKRKKRKNSNNTNSLTQTTNLKEELNTSSADGYTNAVEGLIRIIINYPEYISNVKERLPADKFDRKIYREIMFSVYDLYKRRDKFEIDGLLEELSGKKENLLVKLSVQEVVSDNVEQELNDYIKKIKEHQVIMKLEELNEKIEQAEAEGNIQKVNELLQKYQQYQSLLRKEGN